MARLASRERLSFSKLREVKDLPNLIEVQTDSFHWFLEEGVAEVLRDISPIEDFTGQLKLELTDHVFDPPKHSEDECRERDMTYARPLFVTARFMNAQTGEIKEQTVFMGDFPMMTDRGTFIINGTERIVVSQLVRSPGVYFGVSADKTAPEKEIVDAKVIPSRGAWLEFEVDKKRRRVRPHRPQAQAAGHRAAQGARLRRDRRGAAPAHHRREGPALRVDAQHAREGPHRDRSTRRSSTSTASSVRASRRPPTRRARCSRTCSSTRSATTRRRSAGTRSRRSSRRSTRSSGLEALRPRDPERQRREPQRRLHAHEGRHPRDGLVPREAAQPRRRLLPRRHRPLRQPPGAHRRRAHPEPAPRRPEPHGAGRARAHDDAGRRGDHAADADQHPAGGRGDQGVLRVVAAVAVHGPDEPARGAHAQAPPVGARSGRSVA